MVNFVDELLNPIFLLTRSTVNVYSVFAVVHVVEVDVDVAFHLACKVFHINLNVYVSTHVATHVHRAVQAVLLTVSSIFLTFHFEYIVLGTFQDNQAIYPLSINQYNQF
jgi:hypothetical protein